MLLTEIQTTKQYVATDFLNNEFNPPQLTISKQQITSLTQIKGLRDVEVSIAKITKVPITDLYGAPKQVNITLYLQHLNNLKTVDGNPITFIALSSRCSVQHCTQLTNLSNCYKTFIDLHVLELIATYNIKKSILGTLRIKGLHIINSKENSQNSDLEKAIDIINTYLPVKTMSDIIKCKQELINAGLKSYATF